MTTSLSFALNFSMTSSQCAEGSSAMVGSKTPFQLLRVKGRDISICSHNSVRRQRTLHKLQLRQVLLVQVEVRLEEPDLTSK